MHSESLPFDRGTTWGGGLATLGTAIKPNLAGRTFEVPDTVHGTDKMVTLRCVQLRTSVAITSARKFYSFAADYYGTGIDGVAGAVGEMAKPMDDAYAVGTTIPAYDYFYVVDGGPCYVNTASDSVNLGAFAPVTTDATGFVDGAAPAVNKQILGYTNAALTTKSTAVVIEVATGLTPGVGGGS